MAGKGGYQKPNHPAPVSGPGAMSRRTDGGPADRQAMRDIPDAKYGEQKDFQAIQAGAPMAEQDPRAGLVPLSAPTERPDEPVTAGNPYGAGVGPEAAGLDQRSLKEQDSDHLARMLPMLEFMANMPDASPSSRLLVRKIKANLTR